MAEAMAKGIDALPQAGQSITHEGKEYTTIKEGLAHILVPHDIPTSTDPRMSKEDTQKQAVFYNPIQQFNRDLSVLAIKTFGEDAIVRKQEKHDQAQKRAERKKRKAANGVASEEQGAAPQEGSEPSRKRKLRDDDPAAADPEEVPAKRIKSIPDGAAVSAPVVGEASAALPQTSTQPVTTEDLPQMSSHSLPAEDRPAWRPQFSILDALSATGLRALRYAQEIPFATSVTANDMSEKATASIALNVKHNKLEDKIQANTGNAISYMYSFIDKKGFDVIDLDPYGTAAPFIDSAIQAINDDGLLCVTCTDSAIFASHGYLEKTYSQYGGLPLKGEPCHEGGLRLILHAIASSAARYGMAIEPLLSLSIDYYIRVFVRVRKCPNDVKLLAGKTMLVYHCDSGCGAWTTQFLARNKAQQNRKGEPFYKHSFAQAPSANEHCEHCGHKTHLSGPMYGGPLHNVDFIKRILAQLKEADRETYPTMDRIEGMLHTAMEEITFGTKEKTNGTAKELLHPLIPKADPAEVDHHPFFFIPTSISKVIHCSSPPCASIRGALRHAGFRVAMSHCKPGSIKTDASWRDIWHVMLEWARQKKPLKNALKKESAGHAIVSKATALQSKPTEKERPPEEAVMTSTMPPGQVLDQALNGESATKEAAPANDENGVEGASNGNKAVRSDRPSYLGIDFEVIFDEKLGRDQDRGKLVRYQIAPRENWGPMSRAK
ncbi:TRM-domain-containing protein [Lentithecium fluviatile CBS 122367]|uniref:tRNA (guanine(26)-N(2))-dimethyltransferase n=1 Tax=Lentithecium fluviatile CBS 122367 TaxID=1168545 RepID=A0A6G1IK33_9PLEO|nr:TRM-domain-containing protein [Lentithecium fluviatile CBS 122367]